MFDPDNSRRDFIKENRKEIQENARENVRCTQQKIHFPRHNNYEAAQELYDAKGITRLKLEELILRGNYYTVDAIK